MLKKYIKEQLSTYLSSIADKHVYAISILVTCNEGYSYKTISRFFNVSISYNCNSDNQNEFETEEKWNIAFWDDSDEYFIIDPEDNTQGAEILYQWFQNNSILNVGYEDESQMYDENMNYIGNGPNGYKELCLLIAKIINELRKSGVVCDIIKDIPVLIHDYDYSWYIIDFITIANPNNEADEFLDYYRRNINNTVK